MLYYQYSFDVAPTTFGTGYATPLRVVEYRTPIAPSPEATQDANRNPCVETLHVTSDAIQAADHYRDVWFVAYILSALHATPLHVRDRLCNAATRGGISLLLDSIVILHKFKHNYLSVKHAMNKSWDKFRRASARAAWWDYAENAAYFITICTKDRRHFFGSSVEENVRLSPIGQIAEKCWKEIPLHFPLTNVNNFVIMPNHLHGIVIINSTSEHRNRTSSPLKPDSLEESKFMSYISPTANSLPTIIRSFKSAVSKMSREINPAFGWQPRYHDRIVRDEGEYERIVQYIKENPKNWRRDEFNETKA